MLAASKIVKIVNKIIIYSAKINLQIDRFLLKFEWIHVCIFVIIIKYS